MNLPGELQHICDCPTRDAMVCRDNPECQPSYCKMKRLTPVFGTSKCILCGSTFHGMMPCPKLAPTISADAGMET
jgi:hypothetical protein